MTKRVRCDVSIICANYNNGKFLNQFLESVRKSSVDPKELIVIDDGSEDNSLEILQNANMLYLKVIALKTNMGFANALNKGIDVATGKYILRIDPDDLMTRHRLEEQYEFLERNNEFDIIGSNARYISGDAMKVLGESNFPLTEAEIINRYRKGEHGLLHGTVMAKTGLFKDNRYIQKNVPAEDYDIFSRMILKGARPLNINKVLTLVRIHEDSVSNDLPSSTVKKTYHLRDELFNTKTSSFTVTINYLSLKYYRKYFFERNFIKKGLYLVASAFFRPDKALSKLF